MFLSEAGSYSEPPLFSVITFEVVTSNRYKLNKKYRRVLSEYGRHPEDADAKKQLELAKVYTARETTALETCEYSVPPVFHLPLVCQAAAEAEDGDNESEQSRLRGKPLRYGEIVQVHKHILDRKTFFDRTSIWSAVLLLSEISVAPRICQQVHPREHDGHLHGGQEQNDGVAAAAQREAGYVQTPPDVQGQSGGRKGELHLGIHV